MVVYENEKVSQRVLDIYAKENVSCCSLDDCYSGSSTSLKDKVIFNEVNEELSNMGFDIREMLAKIYRKNNMSVTDEEDSAFFKKVVKGIKPLMKDGTFSLKYKN